MKQPVRMKDIADNLGISIVSVSKALSGKEGVGKELRKLILTTADKMGYHKTEEKEKKANYTIGILLAQRLQIPEHSFYWELYLQVVEALKSSGYYGMLEIISPTAEDNSTIPDFITDNRVDGIFVLGRMRESYIQMLTDTEVPVVLLDFYCDNEKVTSIVTDSFLGGYDITNHLIHNGHHEIGFVGSTDIEYNTQDRFYGYLKALNNHKIPFRSQWWLPDRNEDGWTFKRTFPLPEVMPTAFVCSNDQCAFHFAEYLLKEGYKIPEDISIIGFYNHIFSVLSATKISTYCIDLNSISQKAVAAILLCIQKQPTARRMMVDGRIIERESVKKLN